MIGLTKEYDRKAGLRRNVIIASVCNEAVVFWDGKSSGARHILNELHIRHKPVKIIRIDMEHPLDSLVLPKKPPCPEPSAT